MIKNNLYMFSVVYKMFESNVNNGLFTEIEYYKELNKLQNSLLMCKHFAEMLLTEKERREINGN